MKKVSDTVRLDGCQIVVGDYISLFINEQNNQIYRFDGVFGKAGGKETHLHLFSISENKLIKMNETAFRAFLEKNGDIKLTGHAKKPGMYFFPNELNKSQSSLEIERFIQQNIAEFEIVKGYPLDKKAFGWYAWCVSFRWITDSCKKINLAKITSLTSKFKGEVFVSLSTINPDISDRKLSMNLIVNFYGTLDAKILIKEMENIIL